MIPGELIPARGDIILNAGREHLTLAVTNTGARSILVGSHRLFHETNPALKFNRKAAFCKRLDIPAGTLVRFAPGEKRRVDLVGPAPGSAASDCAPLQSMERDRAGRRP